MSEEQALLNDLIKIDFIIRSRGVPKTRAKHTLHALDVLLARLDKEINFCTVERDRALARVAELEVLYAARVTMDKALAEPVDPGTLLHDLNEVMEKHGLKGNKK